jgi:hypothetical protein
MDDALFSKTPGMQNRFFPDLKKGNSRKMSIAVESYYIAHGK